MTVPTPDELGYDPDNPAPKPFDDGRQDDEVEE